VTAKAMHWPPITKPFRMVLSNGDDEPMLPKMPSQADVPIPMMVAQQNNGRFYDVVMPTITRSAFVKAAYYRDGMASSGTPFTDRGDTLVWRGSSGCAMGCGKKGRYYYPDRSNGTDSCDSPSDDNKGFGGRNCGDHPRWKLVEFSVQQHPECIEAAISQQARFHKQPSTKEQQIDRFCHSAPGCDKAKLAKMILPAVAFSEYKYVLTVGNNGFADRMKNLLANGNVVFFVDDGYKEWYYDALVPFVHYIPIALDLSDLCEKLEWMKANQTAAAQMSANAREFFAKYLHPHMKDHYIYTILGQWSELYDKHVTQKLGNTTAACA